MSYIPTGCDQQGRYPEAAEAATEIGADDFDDAAQFIIWHLVIAIVIARLSGAGTASA